MISDDEDFVPILDELLDLYPAVESVRLLESHRGASGLAHGWYQRTHRSCEAVIGLDRLGYSPEAAPIRRTIIEHVVALKWLADEGDNILDAMALEHAHRAERIAKATQAANWTSVDQADIRAVIDEIDVDSRDQTMKEFTRFTAQNRDPGVLAAYLAEVGRTHATYQSAVDYYDGESGSPLRGSRMTDFANIKFAADELLEATVAFHSMFQEPVWAEELDDLAARSRTANDRVRERRGLPAVDWDAYLVRPSEK